MEASSPAFISPPFWRPKPIQASLARPSNRPLIRCPSGRFVGFTSDASNLVAGDTNNKSDVFVRGGEPSPSTEDEGAVNSQLRRCSWCGEAGALCGGASIAVTDPYYEGAGCKRRFPPSPLEPDKRLCGRGPTGPRPPVLPFGTGPKESQGGPADAATHDSALGAPADPAGRLQPP